MPEQATIETIVNLIRRLTPAQRRVLVRRLSVSGLLPPEELTTDQRRTAVAPALGIAAAQQVKAAAGEQTALPPPTSAPARAPLRVTPPRTTGDQPSIRGHIVLGAPDSATANVAAPHQMAPLPGQAPEDAIVITLRGLTLPAGEVASADYVVRWPGYSSQPVQVRFAGQPTPEQALYDTLEKALRAVLSRLNDSHADPATAHVEIYCPSDPFIDELIGETPVADARLQTRHDRVSALLDRIGEWRLLRAGDS
jgi:hypothetical protein